MDTRRYLVQNNYRFYIIVNTTTTDHYVGIPLTGVWKSDNTISQCIDIQHTDIYTHPTTTAMTTTTTNKHLPSLDTRPLDMASTANLCYDTYDDHKACCPVGDKPSGHQPNDGDEVCQSVGDNPSDCQPRTSDEVPQVAVDGGSGEPWESPLTSCLAKSPKAASARIPKEGTIEKQRGLTFLNILGEVKAQQKKIMALGAHEPEMHGK